MKVLRRHAGMLTIWQRKAWSAEEVCRLHELYMQHMSPATIAEILGRTRASIDIKAFRLKLLEKSDSSHSEKSQT
jgi:hypothetical protein